mgnify:CR=1 FL=1
MDIKIIMSFSPSGSAGEYRIEYKSGVFFDDKVSQEALKHEMLRLQAEDPSRNFVTEHLSAEQVKQIRTKCGLR